MRLAQLPLKGHRPLQGQKQAAHRHQMSIKMSTRQTQHRMKDDKGLSTLHTKGIENLLTYFHYTKIIAKRMCLASHRGPEDTMEIVSTKFKL
jgi:hypothetical protein